MKENVKDALAQNDFETAFSLLEQAGVRPDSVLHIRVDYNALLDKEIEGMITDEEATVGRARLRGRILKLLEKSETGATTGGEEAIGQANCPVKVFMAYNAQDENHAERLETFLNPSMIFPGRIELTKMQELDLGNRASAALDNALSEAKIALLLVTPNFAGDRVCFQVSSKVMQLFEERDLVVIPIKIANADLQWLPFKDLLALPSKLPEFIVDWSNKDAAYVHVVNRIDEVIKERFDC